MRASMVLLPVFCLSLMTSPQGTNSAATAFKTSPARQPSAANTLSAQEMRELSVIPDTLHIQTSQNQKVAVRTRKATLKEIRQLLKSDESDELEENLKKFWSNKDAYYRWTLEEQSLITDIVKEVVTAEGDLPPEVMPTVVFISAAGKERILGFGASYGGDVKFHTDSELRAKGYRGIGTVLIADYLRYHLLNSSTPSFDSVNNSFGFYEKLGFLYSNPELTPDLSKNPAEARFPMYMPHESIPAALKKIKANNNK